LLKIKRIIVLYLSVDDGAVFAVEGVGGEVDGDEAVDLPASGPQAQRRDEVVRDVNPFGPGGEPAALEAPDDVVCETQRHHAALAHQIVHRLRPNKSSSLILTPDAAAD